MGGLYKSMPWFLCHCIPPVAKEKLKDKILKIQGGCNQHCNPVRRNYKGLFVCALRKCFCFTLETKELLHIKRISKSSYLRNIPKMIHKQCCI